MGGLSILNCRMGLKPEGGVKAWVKACLNGHHAEKSGEGQEKDSRVQMIERKAAEGNRAHCAVSGHTWAMLPPQT